MANKNPKLENLTSYKPKWNAGKTKTIRVPIAIADRVLEIAHQIDEQFPLSAMEQLDAIYLPTKFKKELDTTCVIDKAKRQQIKIILADAFTIKANRGGEIKKSLGRLAVLLGFKVEKKGTNQSWIIKGK